MNELLYKSRIWIDEAFSHYLKNSQWHPDLVSYSKHVLIGGGKAARPALIFWTYQNLNSDFSKPSQFVIDWALALEMVHTYSLIHDDLPAMDNDDFRRGRPTLHRLINDAAAILTGDALLTGAFEVLAQSSAGSFGVAQATSLLARAAGGAGMVGGQMRDMFEKNSSLNDLEKTHLEKTGALFACACTMASLACDSKDSNRQEKLSQFGYNLGLLFQMVDDVLDASSTREVLGKSAHKDEHSQKRTYVSILGLEETKAKIKTLSESIHKTGSEFFVPQNLNKMLSFFTNRIS